MVAVMLVTTPEELMSFKTTVPPTVDHGKPFNVADPKNLSTLPADSADSPVVTNELFIVHL